MSNAYIGDEGPSVSGGSIDWQGGLGQWGIAKFGDDRRAIVFFHKQSVFNEVKSTQAGRRIYDEADFVAIQHPGEREQKIDRPVKQEDKYRWPAQWEAYQKNRAQIVEGTPIDLLFPNHPGIADNLKSAGVTTIEQLANLSSTGMSNIGMGSQDYVNYARSYLEHAQKGVGFHQFQKEMADKDQQLKIQGQQIDQLRQQLDTLLKQNMAIVSTMPVPAAPMPVAPVPQPFSMPPIPARMAPQSVESTQEQPKRKGWPAGKPRKPRIQEEPQATNAAD